MNIVLDIDNTLFKTQEFLKENNLLNAPTRPIPYWGFEVIDDAQVERDIEIYRSIPLKLIPVNELVVKFVETLKFEIKELHILTGRKLTKNEVVLISKVLDTKKIIIEDSVSFVEKMEYLDSLKNFIVVDDWSGLESFIRDLHPTHNCYYVIPDLDQIHDYSRFIMVDLFKHKHMWFNVLIHPEHFEDPDRIKNLCQEILRG